MRRVGCGESKHGRRAASSAPQRVVHSNLNLRRGAREVRNGRGTSLHRHARRHGTVVVTAKVLRAQSCESAPSDDGR